MDHVAAKLIEEHLAGEASFLLCDACAPTFTVRYASTQLAHLLGRDVSECLGKGLTTLLGNPEEASLDTFRLTRAVEACGLRPQEVKAALRDISKKTEAQCSGALAEPSRRVGFSLELCHPKHGDLLTCEIVILVVWHPNNSTNYMVVLVRDVSKELPASELLNASWQKEYVPLAQRRAAAMINRASQLETSANVDTMAYLHQRASEMWTIPGHVVAPPVQKQMSTGTSRTGAPGGSMPVKNRSASADTSASTGTPPSDCASCPSMPPSPQRKARDLRPMTATEEGESKPKVCVYYLRGSCEFGNKCKFSHAVEEATEVADVEAPGMREEPRRAAHCLASINTERSAAWCDGYFRGSRSAREVLASVGSCLSIADFDLRKTVGTGTFGRVRMVKVRGCADRTPYALKIMKKREIVKMKQVDHVRGETSILTQVNHPFLVNMLAHFQDEHRLFLVLEYVNGGELFSRIRKSGGLPLTEARFFSAEIVLAFTYLHQRTIAHRDLKPENILITAEGHVKLADFGFAKLLGNEGRTFTVCGTPEYVAPEMIMRIGHGTAVDWWALGILLFEMITGQPPFHGSTDKSTYTKILTKEIPFRDSFNKVPKDLIRRLLVRDPRVRFGNLFNGPTDIVCHKWYEGVDWDMLYKQQVEPPFVPRQRSSDDTSMFDKYPESGEESAAALTLEDQQLFAGL